MDALCAMPEPRLSGPATAGAHAWLREPLYRELEAAAIRRREHVDAHAAKLLTAVILLGISDEVLTRAEEMLCLR